MGEVEKVQIFLNLFKSMQMPEMPVCVVYQGSVKFNFLEKNDSLSLIGDILIVLGDSLELEFFLGVFFE